MHLHGLPLQHIPVGLCLQPGKHQWIVEDGIALRRVAIKKQVAAQVMLA
jgi:hypothetical protein